jgi:hypothetical protein
VSERLRVALDLDGSLESLGDSMGDLADALVAGGEVDLARLRTRTAAGPGERALAGRRHFGPLWRRGLGPPVDRRVGAVDVLHVAGIVTPPTRALPLVISVDDLRPLREETRIHQRVAALERALARGATLVASSRAAARQISEVLSAARSQVRVVPPAVPAVETTRDGADLVVNVTGAVERFVSLAPALAAWVGERGGRLVAVASTRARQRIGEARLEVDARPREEARQALARARLVVHLSDGARFPSFAFAALAAGVPTVARTTAATRELLEGAAVLVEEDRAIVDAVISLWSDEARRDLYRAAGRDRAADYSPPRAASAYLGLYHDVVRGWGA